MDGSRPPATPPALALADEKVELSILIPLHNEADNVPLLYTQVSEALSKLGRTWEIILIDDGSTDGTRGLIEALADQDSRVIAIGFARNFGQTAALLAGIDHAGGRVIVPMDGDLRNSFLKVRNTFSVGKAFCRECHADDTLEHFQRYHDSDYEGSP